MREARLLILAGLVSLAGCADFAPYATAPRPAPEGVVDPGSRVAICYDTLWTSLAQVRNAAQQECSPNTTAEPVSTDWYLLHCPLLLPARATFVCRPNK
ncbi:MAG: hypothetical protein JO305_02820 [Alphaproteobacteria bacterium]|nr:hypothetical protein [Alphaproteobacteria bacterium]